MPDKQTPGLAADLDALATAPPARRGPRCAVGTFLEIADEADAETLRRILDTPGIPAARIAVVLSRHGCRVSAYTVARHRRRETPNGCRCTQ